MQVKSRRTPNIRNSVKLSKIVHLPRVMGENVKTWMGLNTSKQVGKDLKKVNFSRAEERNVM